MCPKPGISAGLRPKTNMKGVCLMLAWLSANISTILISLVLILIVAAIVYKLVKDKKKGKHSCGCDCAHCAMAGSCHSKR